MEFLILNTVLIVLIFCLYFNKNLLAYFKGGNLWLTWFAIGIITLMDELTSIFYAPSEAFHHYAHSAGNLNAGLVMIVFIPFTSIIIRYLTTRMVQIAEILDRHKLKGGGVYNFSYFVLGPLISFMAVASILIDYILTAAISTVSAVENAASLLPKGSGVAQFFTNPLTMISIELTIVWLVASLNILGIRENVKVTYTIFIATAVVLLNFLLMGLLDFDASNVAAIKTGWNETWHGLTEGNFFHSYYFVIAAVSNCILAYSGIESVLQTARLSESWQSIKKAYSFLALSVGLFTPVISVLVLSGLDFNELDVYRNSIMTFYAQKVSGGQAFAIVVGVIASVTLIMAVNTACVASSELIERVAHRYGFEWIVKTNARHSLYRIHIATACFFSFIILITYGQIPMLAEMYAVGLVAGFVINLAALLIYNYRKGTKEISPYFVRRSGTIILFVILLSCFIYLCVHKPNGFILWAVGTAFCLAVGVYGTRKRMPELKEIARGDTPLDVILYVAELEGDNIHIHFKRPQDTPQEKIYDVTAFITLYSPRQKIPPKLRDSHFRIPFKRAKIFDNIEAILHLMCYELPHKNITVHFGWPTASWFDRLSTGVMVFQLIKLPEKFPQINFKMERFKPSKPRKKG